MITSNMRFKLLHVRPHVWFLKQKETLASKATSDDNSSPEGPFVYKRSTSLKLVKSGPSTDSRKGSWSPLPLQPAPSGTDTVLSNKRVNKQGKNVQVCTVVDAGCTCRATVTSEQKQKRALGLSNASSKDLGSLHDVCRPRRAHVLEMKREKDDAAAPKAAHLPAKSPSNSTGTNGSMVSRLVCRSSRDVIKHTQLDAGQRRINISSTHDEGTQFSACAAQIRDEEVSAMQFDVHELECRLRNAGLEERRRSSHKENKLYYEEESLTSSGVGSSLGTSANMETELTTTTSEMQDMLLNVNPTFDTNILPASDRVMSLDDLRASIAQKKLANLSPRPSLCTDKMGLFENVAFTGSPSSFSSETARSTNAGSPECMRHPNVCAHKEKLEVNVKHVDVRVNRRMGLSGFDGVANQGLVKQSHRVSSNMLSEVKEVARDDLTTPRRAARRIDLGLQKEIDAAQYDITKSRVKRCLTQGGSHRFHVGLAPGGTHAHDADIDVRALERRVLGYPESEIGQDKQVVSSSSCEIQVLSDYHHDYQSDAGYKYPMLRIHGGATSSTSSTSDGANAGVHISEEGTPAQELMQSDSAVAMVKSSYDPKCDFKESMLEMVMAKRLRTPRQLQQLLQCYLSLNPPHYHPIIIKVFHELCSELFN